MVARQYRTEHHEIVVRPDAVDLVSRLVRHFDEPFGDSSAIPTFIVSEFAVRHVKVALSGDGGDELFAGYDRFQTLAKIAQTGSHARKRCDAFISWMADRLPYSAYGKNYLHMLSRSTALERYFESNFSPWFLRKELLQPSGCCPPTAPTCIVTGGLPASGQCRSALAGALFRNHPKPAWRHAGQSRPHVHGKFSRSALSYARSRTGEMAASIPHDWKISEGKGKYIFAARARRSLAGAVAEPPQDGIRGAARAMVSWRAAPVSCGTTSAAPRFSIGALFRLYSCGRCWPSTIPDVVTTRTGCGHCWC